MKRLVFYPGEQYQGSAIMFANLYSTFSVGERFIQGIRAIMVGAKIYNKLDAISDRIIISEGNEQRRLMEKGGMLKFQDEEYDLLKESVVRTLELGHNGSTTTSRGTPFRILDATHAAKLIEFVNQAEEVQE